MPNTLLVFICGICSAIIYGGRELWLENKRFWKREEEKERERNRKYWHEVGDEEAKEFYENCKN